MTATTCSIDDCDRRVDARGWCSSHYNRWRRHGDPTVPLTRASPGQPMAFLQRTVANPPKDSCVIWPYATGARGYARIRYDNESAPATRVALILHAGRPTDDSLEAAHAPLTCHNTLCVNPLHLRWATHQENMADTILDGTSHRGSAHPMAKLTERQVIAIRADDRTADTIAAEYGIAEATVRGLWRRVNWSWLEAAS